MDSPWAAECPDSLDLEALERLKPRALPRSKSIQARIVRSAAERVEHGSGLQRAGSDLRETVKQALERTSSIKSAISRSSSAGAKEFLSAIQKTTSGNFMDASAQMESAWRKFERGSFAHGFARALVCLFFMDCCLERYQNWQFYQTEFMQQRAAKYPHRYKDPGFPYWDLWLILPCAVLTILGVGTRLTASILVLDMLQDSAGIMLAGFQAALRYKIQPEELAVKHLAMLGSAALLLAHAVQDKYATSNTVAGLLIGERGKDPGPIKSIALLFGRLALAVLFITVGISQGRRVIQRDWAFFVKHEFLRIDGHDNNFLLVEATLAVPFALGIGTRWTAPLLALTLLGEAVWCWWPLETWPSVQYQSHVRSHFATNLGAAGGLLLLRTYGAGIYTVDKLLNARKRV